VGNAVLRDDHGSDSVGGLSAGSGRAELMDINALAHFAP